MVTLLNVNLNQVEKLINRLNIYKLNSQIEILNLSNEFQVAVISIDKFLFLKIQKIQKVIH